MQIDSRFQYRKMTQKDKPRLLEISSKIWEGHDYLPYIFDKWLSDNKGQFVACMHKDALIGCIKLSFVAAGHAWLEGLRKDIDIPLKGVGKALSIYLLHELKAYKGLKSIRFATYALDIQSITLNERLGFQKIATRTVRSKIIDPASKGFNKQYAPLMPENGKTHTLRQVDSAKGLWETTKPCAFDDGFLCASWTSYPAESHEVLDFFIEAGTCLQAINSQGQESGTVIYNVDTTKKMVNIIALKAKDESAAKSLLFHIEDVARKEQCPEVFCFAPTQSGVLDVLDRCYYEPWEHNDDFLIYEYPLDKLYEKT